MSLPPWVLAALATAVTAAAMFVSIAALGRRGWAPTHTLRGVYGLATIGFAAWALWTHRAAPAVLWPGWLPVGLLALAGAMTWVGNVGVAVALPRAPNPGYGLAALGTCSAVIAIGAWVVYGVELSGWAILGIGLCIAGLPLLAGRRQPVADNSTESAPATTQGPWLPGILLAVALFSASLLTMRGLGQGQAAVDASVQLWWLYLAMTVCLFLVRAPPLEPGSWWRSGWIVALGATACWIANECQVFAALSAPNPGYAIAIAGLQTPLAAVLGVLLFGDRFGGRQALGVLCCLLGATIIALAGDA